MEHKKNSQPYVKKTRLAIVTLVSVLTTSACAVAAEQTTAKTQAEELVHHSFEEVSTGRAAPTRGALNASVHSYKSEDGTVVQLREWYKSASDASSGLDALIKKASRVIKQGTKKDARGGIIGKRVELIFSRGHKASAETVIAWTDGATVVRLRSTSLPLLLDFESQFYP